MPVRPRTTTTCASTSPRTHTGNLSAVNRLCLLLEMAASPTEVEVAIRVGAHRGELAQVDFGYAGERNDHECDVLRKSWVFVMMLAYSRRYFSGLVLDQTIGTWIWLQF